MDHGQEIRAYVRDADGRLIEIGQATGMLAALEHPDVTVGTAPMLLERDVVASCPGPMHVRQSPSADRA